MTNNPKNLIWVVILILGLGVFFRVYQWQQKSLWQDELYTVASAMGVPLFETTMDADNEAKIWGSAFDPELPVKPIQYLLKLESLKSSADFWQGIQHNIQAPLYPLLIRAKSQLFGTNPVANRLLSIIFALLVLPIAYLLGKTLRDELGGLLLLCTTSLSGFLIIYSQTARLYSLLFFILMLFLTFAVRLHQNRHTQANATTQDWKNWLGFGLTALTGLYTHYYFALPVMYTGIVLTLANRRDSEFLKHLWQTAGFVIMGFIPGMLLFQQQTTFMVALGDETLSGSRLSLSLIERLWNTLTSLIAPKNIILQITSTLIIVFALIKEGLKKNWFSATYIAAFGIAFFIAVLLFVDIANNTHRIATKRYFIFVAPVMLILLSEGLRQLWQSNWHKHVKLTLITVLAASFIWNAWTVSSGDRFLQKEDYRSTGQLISQKFKKNDLVLVSHSAVHSIGVAYYLPSDIDMLGINRRNWDDTILEQKLVQLAKDRQRVWLVFTHTPGKLKNTLRDWFSTRGSLSEEGHFSSIQVYLWTPDTAYPQ